VTAAATSTRTGIALPAALSLIAGVTDVTSWLLLGGFFSAHVTGNMVVLAARLVEGRAPDPAAVLAIPLFVVVTALATVLARTLARSGSDPTLPLLGAQAALLIVAAGLSFTTRASADPSQPLAVVIGLCAVAAMAAQNAFLHLVPSTAPSTAVMTGNLVTATVAGVDLLLGRAGGRALGRDTAAARAHWHASWPLLAGFVGGCLVGAVGAATLGDTGAVVPAALATALFVIVLLVIVAARRPPTGAR
jgi:uncharacterized membrane protein YoaK (UPF0700 family)